MAELCKFFNSSVDDIREYNATHFSDFFKQITDNGLKRGNLIPSITGDNLNITISKGEAIIQGYSYTNTQDLILTTDIGHSVLDRMDRVVLRLNLIKNTINAIVLKGTPNKQPTAPNLVRNKSVFDISLCSFLVRSGKSFIAKNDFIDERLNKELCGMKNNNNFINYNMKITKLENNKPIEIEYKDSMGVLFKKTILENKDNFGNYQILYEQDFLEDGSTVGLTTKWNLTYNENGVLIERKAEVI